MAPAPDSLTLLPFPQAWDGAGTLTVRILALPRGNPLLPLFPGTPAFADTDLALSLKVIDGLDRLPDPADVSEEIALPAIPSADSRTLFETVAPLFNIDPALEASLPPQRRAGVAFRQFLPESYREAFAFTGPRTPFAVTDDSWLCALDDACRKGKPEGPPPDDRVTWGNVVAYMLRNPTLAATAGLLYEADLTLGDPQAFADGGWIYPDLAAADAYAAAVAADPTRMKVHAARIPPLGAEPRPLFAAVLFPGPNAGAVAGNFDEIFAEAAAFDDGFAKIVHCTQARDSNPAGIDRAGGGKASISDSGIDIGVDDEQLLIWMNRQVADPTVETRDCPMGVQGYRVDVRPAGGAGAWSSLLRVSGPVRLPPLDMGVFEGEFAVQPAPVQLDNEDDGDYWLSPYIEQWRGWSMATRDPLAATVSGDDPATADGAPFSAVDPLDPPLRYGQSYDFRVRLADIAGGGPAVADSALNPAEAPVATCGFRRHVRPGNLRLAGVPDAPAPEAPPGEIRITRPKLGYPAAVFADAPDARTELANAAAAAAAGQRVVPGVSDPDVDRVQITLLVGGLSQDPDNATAGNPPLYEVLTTTRALPGGLDDTLALELEWRDIPDIAAMADPGNGALVLPRARTVVLRLQAIGRDDPGLTYWAGDSYRVGPDTEITLRAAARDETALLGQPADPIVACLLQPDPAPTTPHMAAIKAAGQGEETDTDMVGLLANALGLQHNGMTLAAPTGERVIFGAARTLPHVLGPDGATLAINAKADIANVWVVALTIDIDRDWTWDGLSRDGIAVSRDGAGTIGRIRPPRILSNLLSAPGGASGRSVDRSKTRVVFLDVVDPAPQGGAFPTELQLSYQLSADLRDAGTAADGPIALAVDLPIAVPPVQTPKLVSAGRGATPYLRSEDYARTEARTRGLWLEFEEPPANPIDRYFVRVLAHAPDPMLSQDLDPDDTVEPPLAIDPEPIRIVRPGQSDDRAGLSAMQPLIPTDSPTHFYVPLPPGLYDGAPDLFGMYTYEIRVGHYADTSGAAPDFVWSTAQGRYGPALRATGVQHPPPGLTCTASRDYAGIVVTAPFADPDGSLRRRPRPPTEMWMLLYAQVTQTDGADRRNILLGRKRAALPPRKDTGPSFSATHLRFAGVEQTTGRAFWASDEVARSLLAYGLPEDSDLSVLAVETLPTARPDQALSDPLGGDLGHVRLLRTSPLVAVAGGCFQPPCPPPPPP